MTKRIGFAGLALALMGAAGGDNGVPARLIGGAMSEGRALAIAQSLSDGVGARPAGSPGAARAVQWAVQQMKALGFKNVHTEAVKVPHWIRGEATAELLAPVTQPLALTALGPSVATDGELTAEVIEARSFDELKALGDAVKGKIVLFQHDMKRSHGFEEYAHAVGLRGHGAVEAAKLGAVAMLVRSAGTGAHRLPHAGGLRYDAAVKKIPAAALASEDAMLIHRLLSAGQKVKLKLKLTPRSEGEVESANVIGEIPGREKPEQIVLLGAHLDSWDLATGAIDDAAGCAIVMDAARLAGAVGRAPRRTIRVVLFMNEEMGLSGARAYAEKHAGELGKHVAAMEIDSGEGRALGFGAAGGPAAVALMQKLVAPLVTIGVTKVEAADEAGADLTPLEGKVPLVALVQDMNDYFEWHHTAADTFDKIDPMNLAVDTAAVAVAAYGLADATEQLPVGPPPAPRR